MKKCIYCLDEKHENEFTIPEHALNQAFGKFENNLTSFDVCNQCNKMFGETVDIVLARDSVQGLTRYMEGYKKTSDYKHLGMRSKMSYKSDIGLLKGLDSYPFLEDNEIKVMIDVSQICLFNRETETYDRFIIDQLPQKDELDDCYYDYEEHVVLAYAYKNDEINMKLKSKGYDVNIEETRVVSTVAKMSASRVQDDELTRAMAKMIFTIFSLMIGIDEVIKSNFDKIRKFIRYGEYSFEFMNQLCVENATYFYESGQPFNGHIVFISNEDGIWRGSISLYNKVKITIPLGVSQNEETISYKLLYNLDTLTLDK